MNQIQDITVSRHPIRALALALGLTTIAIAGLVWNSVATASRFALDKERDIRISELRGTIVQLDEVLTMSARMAAATGDPRWEERYRIYDPLLAKAITDAQSLTPDRG